MKTLGGKEGDLFLAASIGSEFSAKSSGVVTVDGIFHSIRFEFQQRRTKMVRPTKPPITKTDAKKSQILFLKGNIPACALHMPVAIKTGDQPWIGGKMRGQPVAKKGGRGSGMFIVAENSQL